MNLVIIQTTFTHYEGLNLEAKKRYDVKIITLGNQGDPYAAREKSSTTLEWQNWPSVEYPYVYIQLSNYYAKSLHQR